jgi:hypothetical protein
MEDVNFLSRTEKGMYIEVKTDAMWIRARLLCARERP